MTYTFLPTFYVAFLIVSLDYVILIQRMCCRTADLLSTNTPLWEPQAFHKDLQTPLSLVMNM